MMGFFLTKLIMFTSQFTFLHVHHVDITNSKKDSVVVVSSDINFILFVKMWFKGIIE
jgi:hypothetical protein